MALFQRAPQTEADVEAAKRDAVAAVEWPPHDADLALLPDGEREFVAWAHPLLVPLVGFAAIVAVCGCCCCCCVIRRYRRNKRRKGLVGKKKGGSPSKSSPGVVDLNFAGDSRRGSDASISALDGLELVDADDGVNGHNGGPVHEKAVAPGAAEKVCRYDELNDNNLSDCSAESADFEALFDAPAAATGRPSGSCAGRVTRAVSGLRAKGIEKKGLLTNPGMTDQDMSSMLVE